MTRAHLLHPTAASSRVKETTHCVLLEKPLSLTDEVGAGGRYSSKVKPFTWLAQSPTTAKGEKKNYTENKIDFGGRDGLVLLALPIDSDCL